MTQGLPDDLFRPGAEEGSEQVREEPQVAHAPRSSSVKTVKLDEGGVSPRVLAGILVLALLLAYAFGRLFFFGAQDSPTVAVSPAPLPTVTSSPSPGDESLVAYTDAVVVTPALSADGTCTSDDAHGDPDRLIDDDPGTIWRCPGRGVGEEISFTFSGRRPIVGVRVVNGNTAWADRYQEERRILALRWQFSDGSYFVQGLAANNRNPQEVRFPPVTATGVTLTVLEVTAPGEPSPEHDAVSISSVEFLTPA